MRYLNFLLLIVFLLLTTQCSEDTDLYPLEEDLKQEQVEDFTKSLKSKSREKKNEKWQQDFASIKDEILSRNKNKKFLDRLVKSVGHPDWNWAFSATPSGEGFPYIIPFLKPDDSRANAVLMVKRHKNGKKLIFTLVERNPFANLIFNNKSKFTSLHLIYASIFSYYDGIIYGYEDRSLNKWINSNRGLVDRKSNLKSCDWTQVCYWSYCNYAIHNGSVSDTKCGKWVCTSSYFCGDGGIGGPISGGGSYGGSSGGGGSTGSNGSTCYTCGIDDHQQDSDPSLDYPNLNEVEYYQLLVEGFTIEEIGVIDKLKKAIQKTIQDLSNFLPQTPEEWNMLAEALKIELEKIVTNPRTLAKLVLPGVADIESSLKNFNGGNYLNAAFDISMALVDLVPGTKLANVSLAVATKVRRSLPVVKIFKRIKNLGNSKVANGFKQTLLREMKNGHIFLTKPGHLGNANFDYVLNRAGGQFEMIADVYEEAFRTGKLANLTSNFTRQSITLYGRRIDFTAGQVDGKILISNFFAP